MFGFAAPLQPRYPGQKAMGLADGMNGQIAGGLARVAQQQPIAQASAPQQPAMPSPGAMSPVKPGGQPLTMDGVQMPNRPMVPGQPVTLDGIQMPGMAPNVAPATSSVPLATDALADAAAGGGSGGAGIADLLASFFGG